MTKPVTSVAAMMLYEEGAFELTDPVSNFIPSFASARVYTGGSDQRAVTVPLTEPVRIWHLLTHTSGLTYGFHRVHPVDAMYRAAGFEWGAPPGTDLAAACDQYASIPLLFQPGSEWNYSVSTDVLGRVVEVASGQSLDEFFATRIFAPLGMTETGFCVSEDALPRLAALYGAGPAGTSAGWSRWAGWPSAARRSCWAGAAAWSPPPRTTTGSPRCFSAGRAARAGSWTAPACSARARSPT